jgi:hypothetical protein
MSVILAILQPFADMASDLAFLTEVELGGRMSGNI